MKLPKKTEEGIYYVEDGSIIFRVPTNSAKYMLIFSVKENDTSSLEVQFDGDEIMTFDGPLEAVRYAERLRVKLEG